MYPIKCMAKNIRTPGPPSEILANDGIGIKASESSVIPAFSQKLVSTGLKIEFFKRNIW